MTTNGTTTNSLHRRLLPLYVGVALQGFLLWLPVEKLFMNEIGFDPASVGLMAAAYAGIVPFIEVPSGILADRWSRRGVLVISSVALAVSTLIGGLSHNVATYIVGALVLGVYFALYSGTVESMVYDTVVEETGDGAAFERLIGRARFVESMALVASSLLGGWVASLLPTRVTYLLSVPFVLASIIAYLRFREPRLHRAGEPAPLRRHIATTVRTLTHQRALAPVILLSVLVAVLMQTVFEFGPLWLVAVSAPAVLFGPYWAGLTSTIGIGGLLAGRLDLTRPATLAAVGGLIVASAAALTVTTSLVAITAAQIVLALLLMVISVHVSQLLHDAVPAEVRTGVASGVSTFTWLVFLPFSLVFGAVSDAVGVHAAAALIVGFAVLVVALMVVAARRKAPVAEPEMPAPALVAA
ncbi:MAG TPA: MFS transporter [Actinophytocola sp.]|jgi:MFS family permease|nr:MFS transporter [Actinophytocola sp.]